MNMKKLICSVLALTLCASMLVGCSGSKNNVADNSGKTVITVGTSSDITSLDPQNHNDVTSAYMTRHIYSNLVRLDENNEFVGELAKEWNYVDDVTVEFTLNEGVKVHNGETLTSEDVKFTFERQKEMPKVSHLIAMIDSVEVVDDTHFLIHMNTPSNALISSLAHSGCAILNKKHVEEVEAAGGTIEEKPCGTGQYTFGERQSGASFSLVKYDGYFNPERAAQNDGINFLVYLEDSARTIALETGEIDVMINVPTADAQRIRDNEALNLDEKEGTRVEMFIMNTTKAPFDNKLVRKAINYAINKEDIVTAAVDNEGTAFDNYIGPSAIGYYDTVVKYDYNVEEAKKLLAEAGMADGFEFTVYLSGDMRAKSATIIQDNLAKIGITMKIEQMENSTFYEKTGLGEHEACLTGWIANAEPDNTFRALFTSDKAGEGGNRAFYSNPEVDALVDDAATNRDSEVVQKDYETILATISEDAIWVPLYTMNQMIAHQKDLQGIYNSPISMHDLFGMHY